MLWVLRRGDSNEHPQHRFFYEDLTKVIFELSSNTHLISFLLLNEALMDCIKICMCSMIHPILVGGACPRKVAMNKFKSDFTVGLKKANGSRRNKVCI